MKVLRLTIAAVLFTGILVGCIVQADTFNDQDPFNAPDTLQSGSDSDHIPTAIPGATPTPQIRGDHNSKDL
ncbi:MAG: hypothetical protein OXI80_18150 [Caldilineaceae bacterium]|nr:hypothetical protein [Caldilineaceae bacterium]MDE0339604.1 hypothetical protein [Caldilineaceae bacterium]